MFRLRVKRFFAVIFSFLLLISQIHIGYVSLDTNINTETEHDHIDDDVDLNVGNKGENKQNALSADDEIYTTHYGKDERVFAAYSGREKPVRAYGNDSKYDKGGTFYRVGEDKYNNYDYNGNDGKYSLTIDDFKLVPEEEFKDWGKTGGDKNYLKRDFIIVQGAIPLTDIDDDKFAATSIDENNWTSELAFDTYIKGGEFNNEYKNYPIYNDEITDDGLKKIKWQSVNSELVFGILIRVQLNCENTKHPHYEKTQNKIFYLTAVLNGEAYTKDGTKVTCKDKDKSYDYVKLTIDKDAPFHFNIQESDENVSSYGVSYGSSTYTWNIPSAIKDTSKRKVGHVWGIIDKTVSNMALDKSIYNEDNNANIRTKKQENQISLINGVGSSEFNADAAKYIKDYVGAFDKTTQKFENNHLPERVPFHYGLNALLQCEVCQLGQHSSYSAENAFIVPIFSVGKLAPASCEINAQYDLMSSLKISDIRNYYLNIYSDYEIKPSAKDGSPTLYDIIDVSMSTSRRVDTSFTRSNWAASRSYKHDTYEFPKDTLIYADGDELSKESVDGGQFYGGDLGLLDNALALGHHWEVDTTVGNDGWLWKDVEGSAEMIATIYFVCTRPECLRSSSNHGYPIYQPNKTMSFAVKTTTDVSEQATCTSPGKFGYKSEDVFKSETFNEYLKQQDNDPSGNYRVTFDTFYITDEKGTREVLFERTINGNEQGKFRGKFVFGGDGIVQLQDGQDNIELSSTMASGLSSLPLGHVWTNVFGNVSELSFSEVTGFNGDDILNAIKAGENTDEISANILKFINVDATSIANANTCPYKNAEIIQESNGWLWMKETNSSGYKIYAVLLMQCGRVDTHFEALVFSEFSNVVGSYDEGEAEYVTSGQSHDYPEMETYRKRISLTALNNDLIKGETEANPDNRDGGYKYKSTYYDSFGRVQYDRYLSSYNDTHDRQAAPHQWIPDTRYDGDGWEWITTTSDSSVKITKAILHLTCNDDNCNATETITFDVDSENIKKLEKEPSVTYEEIDDYSIAMYHHPTDCYSDGVHKYYARITTQYLIETYIKKHPESSIRDFDEFYSDMSHVKTNEQTEFFLNDYTYAADTVATSGHSWTLDTSINETIENKEGLSFSVDELAKIKDLKFTNGIAYKLQDGKDVPSNKNPIYDVYFVLKCSNYETEKSHYIILKVPLTGSYIWSCTESGHAIINLEDAIVKINEYLGNSTTFSETNIEEIKTTTNNHTNHGTAIHDSFDHEIIRTAGTDGGSTILIKYDQNPYDQNPKGHKWTLNTNIDRDGFEWISVTTINGLHFAPRIYFICEECHETMYIDGTNEAYLKFADGGISVTETIQNLSCEEWGAQYLDGILTITEKFYERLKTDKVITEYDQFCLKGNSVTTKPNPGLKYVADRYFASDEVAPLGHSWIVDTSAKQTYSKEQYIDAAGNVYDLSGGKYKDAEGNEHEVSTITASKILSSTLINGYEWVKVEGSDTYRVFVHYVCTNNILVSDEGIDGPSTIAMEATDSSHKMVKEIKNDEFKDPKSSVAKLTSDETYHTDENGYVAPTCTDDCYYVWQAVIGNITMSHKIRKPSNHGETLSDDETINDVFNIDVNLTSCILNEISGEKTGHTYVLNTSVDNDGLQDGFTWDVETNGGDITVVNGATLNFTCETCGALFTHTFSTEDMKTEDVLPTHDKDGFKKYSVSITMSELQKEIESFSRFSDAEAKKETYSSSAEVRNAKQKHTGHKWEPVEDGTTLPGGWKFTDIGDGKVEVTVTVRCVADDCDAEATITIPDNYVTKTTVDAICTLFAYTVVRVGKEVKKVVDGEEEIEIVGFDLYSYVKDLMDKGNTQFTDMDVFYDRKGYVLDPRNNIEDSENSNHAIYEQFNERYNTLIEKEGKESLSTDEENELKTIRENVIFAGYLDWKEYTDLMAEKEKADESRKEEIDARLDELIHKNVIADFHEGHQYNEDGSLNHGRLLETYSYTIDNPANGHNWIVDTSVYSDGYEWKWNETGTEPTKVTLHLICSNCGKEKTFEFTGIDASADHSDNSKQIKATLHEANCYHGDYYTYEVNFELDKSQTIFDGVHIRIDNSVHDYNGELLEMVNKGYISQSVVDEYLIDYEWKGEDGKYIYDSYSSLTGNDKKSTRDGNATNDAREHHYITDTSKGGTFTKNGEETIFEDQKGWAWELNSDGQMIVTYYFKCDNKDIEAEGVKCPFTYQITLVVDGKSSNSCTLPGNITYTARPYYQGKVIATGVFTDTSTIDIPGHNWRLESTFNGNLTGHDGVPADITFENGIAYSYDVEANKYVAYVKLVCTACQESIVVKLDVNSSNNTEASCTTPAVSTFELLMTSDMISKYFAEEKEESLTKLNIKIIPLSDKVIANDYHYQNDTLLTRIVLNPASKEFDTLNGHTWKIDTNYGNGTGWTWELLGENKATATLHFVCGTCGATFEMVQKGLVGVALEKPSCTEDQRVTYTSTMPEFTFEKIVGKGQIEGKNGQVTIINSY